MFSNYLYSYGLNDEDIVEVLNGEDQTYLIPVVQYMVYVENESQQIVSNNLIDQFFYTQTAFAFQVNIESKACGCFKSAIGLDLLVSVTDGLVAE